MLIVSTLCNVGKFKLNVSTTTAVRKDMSFFIPWNTFSRLWNKYSRLWKNHSKAWNFLWLSLLVYMCACCLHYVMYCITVVNVSSVSNVGNILKIQIYRICSRISPLEKVLLSEGTSVASQSPLEKAQIKFGFFLAYLYLCQQYAEIS